MVIPKAIYREIDSLLREAATGPDRSLSLKAQSLLKKLGARKPLKAIKKRRLAAEKEERLSRKGHRAAVRAACMERSGGVCELISDIPGLDANHGPLEFDHFYGRAFSESVETCWMICRDCHRMKTENDPSREAWDGWFKEHCKRHGYSFRPRLIKTRAARSGLRRSKP